MCIWWRWWQQQWWWCYKFISKLNNVGYVMANKTWIHALVIWVDVCVFTILFFGTLLRSSLHYHCCYSCMEQKKILLFFRVCECVFCCISSIPDGNGMFFCFFFLSLSFFSFMEWYSFVHGMAATGQMKNVAFLNPNSKANGKMRSHVHMSIALFVRFSIIIININHFIIFWYVAGGFSYAQLCIAFSLNEQRRELTVFAVAACIAACCAVHQHTNSVSGKAFAPLHQRLVSYISMWNVCCIKWSVMKEVK